MARPPVLPVASLGLRPLRPVAAPARAAAPTSGRGLRLAAGANLWTALARAGQAPSAGGLGVRQTSLLLQRAVRQLDAVHAALHQGPADATVRHAAALLLRDPAAARRQLPALAAAVDVPATAYAPLLPLLGRPASLALLQRLQHALPPALALALLQARLRQLEAINAILRDWGRSLAKWAKLDKQAQARAHKQARALAQQQLAALAVHRDLLGHVRARAQADAAAQADAVTQARLAERSGVLEAAPAAVGEAPWDKPLANASLVAALTVPLPSGVRAQGRPRSLPAA